VDLNEQFFSSVTKDKQLAFLPSNSPEGAHYLFEMNACLEFARLNRQKMMENIMDAFAQLTEGRPLEFINIHHNYAKLEHHFGVNVYVHRKGATSAREGELGLIPGSQGTASYVVKGKGVTESLNSCSHGAGRKMGRGQAQRTLNLADEQLKLNAKGIIHSVRNTRDLDEAPGSYKDIDTVMQEQQDLVEIVVKLEPLAVIKG
jgi:tRNA-splicing ligase RtcB